MNKFFSALTLALTSCCANFKPYSTSDFARTEYVLNVDEYKLKLAYICITCKGDYDVSLRKDGEIELIGHVKEGQRLCIISREDNNFIHLRFSSQGKYIGSHIEFIEKKLTVDPTRVPNIMDCDLYYSTLTRILSLAKPLEQDLHKRQ